jgi:hypothetical protein
MIKDRNIAWQRKSRFITAGEILAGGFADASGAATHFGTGGPILTEVGTQGIGVLNINGAGNFFHALDFVTPREMDIAEEIGFRVHYMTLGAVSATDDITFIVQYAQVDVGGAVAAAATALDTPITEHRQGVTTTLLTHRTARGIISAGKFDETARQGMIHWEVEADAMDYATNEIGILGFEVDYAPRLTWSNG